jgi:hypothetical protein
MRFEKFPAREDCDLWRSLAASGADLPTSDLLLWLVALRRLRQQIDGALVVVQALPTGSSARDAVEDEVVDALEQFCADHEAAMVRVRAALSRADGEVTRYRATTRDLLTQTKALVGRVEQWKASGDGDPDALRAELVALQAAARQLEAPEAAIHQLEPLRQLPC